MNTVNYFSEKGENAEDSLHKAILKTFLSYWVFKSPKLPNGKELCDFLIVYDDIVIIWQTKDIKIDESGMYSEGDFNKNFRQLSGAKRQLFSLKTPILLENMRGCSELIDINQLTNVFMISTFTGDSQVFIDPINTFKAHTIHVFTGSSIYTLLEELDTISDFIAYLKSRENFLLKSDFSKILLFGEVEMLGYYLMNNRTFITTNDKNAILIIDDIWQHLHLSQKYQDSKSKLQISYLWDSLIEETKDSDEAIKEYKMIAKIMAHLDREERAYLMNSLLEAKKNAINEKSFRRLLSYNGITYCFLFSEDPFDPDDRAKLLKIICLIGRNKFLENNIVLGIATEAAIKKINTYDFAMIDKVEWSQDDERKVLQLQEELGLFSESLPIQ